MEFIFATLIAFVITAIAVPVTIVVAKRYGLVDDPEKRPHPAHVQDRIIPRAGGIAIYSGIVLTGMLFLPIEQYLIGIFIGITLLLIIGILDDKLVEFNPYTRLLLLLLAAIAVVGSGVGIAFVSNPFYHLPIPFFDSTNQIIHLDQIIVQLYFFGERNIVLIADLLALIWIVALTQIINWSKGVDGQMPGITSVAALTLGIFSYMLFIKGDPNQYQIALLSFIVAGSSLAFLIFNWHPSKIMPGFSGSTILAFMLAVLAILSGSKLATAALVLAIPTVDFIYTIIRRIAQGKSPVWGDRGHLHHLLLDRGWSHQKISLFYILGSAILGIVALFVSTTSKLFIVLLVLVIFLGFILWLNSFGGLSKPQDQDNG